MPLLHQGGVVVAVFSLLQPRQTHKHAFRNLEGAEGWFGHDGRPLEFWEETSRLRSIYPKSINTLVVFVRELGGLGDVFDVLRASIDITGNLYYVCQV